MDFGIGTYSLGYAAGVLSILSPCVLPLVPLILGAATAAHRLGALALIAGLVVSFTAAGIFIATIGFSLGLEAAVFRLTAAVLLIGFGIVLISTRLQAQLGTATSGVSNAGQVLLSRLAPTGLPGQFVVGLMLGAIWSPCVGPTLGAAATLASQGADLARVSLLMAVFGIGAATPMIALGFLSRTMISKVRGKLMTVGSSGKYLFGSALVAIGILIFTGIDKSAEEFMVTISPDWLTNLTTRF
ncbi:cytochrome c biogenesis CcdA family protein [Paraburkholderia sp. SIMBA_055]|uniref:cytochrome c biogenesis CcdA family protein n=1 Tax=Paraburkholderia sp. SIMBA_054 TaxID=3085795 RepID=UPI00397B653B